MAYVGALGELRGLPQMLAIAEKVGASTDANLILAGPASAEQQLKHPALRNHPRVQWRGPQNREQVAALLGGVKIGLCLLHPTPAYVEALPTKVLEYMACGAVVVASDFPYWRELFGDAAVYVDPFDTSAAAAVIVRLLGDEAEASALAQRGLTLARTRYNWPIEAEKLVEFYRRRLAA
jgi:glycosyltransferase involved in cell wall biosynthesis